MPKLLVFPWTECRARAVFGFPGIGSEFSIRGLHRSMPTSPTKLILRQAKSVAARTKPAGPAGPTHHQTALAFTVPVLADGVGRVATL